MNENDDNINSSTEEKADDDDRGMQNKRKHFINISYIQSHLYTYVHVYIHLYVQCIFCSI